MQKHLLLVLLLPLSLCAYNRVDPETLHDPCEEHMFKQASRLAWKRTTDNAEAVCAGICASGAYVGHWIGIGATTGGGVVALDLLEAPVIELGAHAIDGLAVSMENSALMTTTVIGAGDPEPVSKVVILCGVVATIAATAAAKQTWGWGWDVKSAYDKKQAFLAMKTSLRVSRDCHKGLEVVRSVFNTHASQLDLLF